LSRDFGQAVFLYDTLIMTAEATEKLWQILQYVKHILLIRVCRLRQHINFCLAENSALLD